MAFRIPELPARCCRLAWAWACGLRCDASARAQASFNQPILGPGRFQDRPQQRVRMSPRRGLRLQPSSIPPNSRSTPVRGRFPRYRSDQAWTNAVGGRSPAAMQWHTVRGGAHIETFSDSRHRNQTPLAPDLTEHAYRPFTQLARITIHRTCRHGLHCPPSKPTRRGDSARAVSLRQPQWRLSSDLNSKNLTARRAFRNAPRSHGPTIDIRPASCVEVRASRNTVKLYLVVKITQEKSKNIKSENLVAFLFHSDHRSITVTVIERLLGV